MSRQQQLREEITNQIVAAIEAGTLPWRRPWSVSMNAGCPTNASTKRAYRGVNPLILDLVAATNGYRSRWWATFNQWKGLGSSVLRGQHGTRIVFSTPMTKPTRKPTGEEVEETFWVLRSFVVFNAQQCVDADRFLVTDEKPVPQEEEARFARAFEVAWTTGADVRHGGNRAFYSIPGDYIQMPEKSTFKDGLPSYFDTLFHELAHWTECRTDWKASPLGDNYAAGELRAELASCYLCNELGIRTDSTNDNTAAYLSSWLNRMKEDSAFIFRISSAATRAADLVMSFSQPVEEPTDTTYESVPC